MSVNIQTTPDGDGNNSAARWGTLVIVLVVLIAAIVVASVVTGSKSPSPQLSAPTAPASSGQ